MNWIDKNWLETKRNVKMLSRLITDNRITMVAANSQNGKTSLVLGEIESIREKYPNKEIIIADYDNGIHRAKSGMLDRLIEDSVKAASISSAKDHTALFEHLDAIDDASDVVFVLDGFQSFCSRLGAEITNPTEMDKTMSIFKTMRDIKGMTIVLIHHNNKKDKEGWSTFRGAASIEDSLDSLLSLNGNREDTKLHINIRVDKFDGMTLAKGDKVSATIEHSGSITFKEMADVEVVLPKRIDQDKLVKAITDNIGLAKTEMGKVVAKELGVGRNTVSTAIEAAIEAKLFYEHTFSHNRKTIELTPEPQSLKERMTIKREQAIEAAKRKQLMEDKIDSEVLFETKDK